MVGFFGGLQINRMVCLCGVSEEKVIDEFDLQKTSMRLVKYSMGVMHVLGGCWASYAGKGVQD